MKVMRKLLCLIVMIQTITLFAEEVVRKDTIYANEYMKKNSDVKDLRALIELYDNGNTVVVLKSGKYVTSQIKITQGVDIVGERGVEISPISGIFNGLIIASAPLKMENIELDGERRILWGVFSTSNLVVVNCEIRNFHGNKNGPGNGVRHLPNDMTKLLQVKNSVIRDISSFEDGVVGNYVGATRGILTSGGTVLISNVDFINIQGEEDADCIHIQTKGSDKTIWTSAGHVIIENCTFREFGKRAIKLQASDVIVRNNDIQNNTNKVFSGISIFGSNNKVDNNVLDIHNATSAITVNSGHGNIISNNNIKVNRGERGSLTWGIAFERDLDVSVYKNNFITNGKRAAIMFPKEMPRSKVSNINRINSTKIER